MVYHSMELFLDIFPVQGVRFSECCIAAHGHSPIIIKHWLNYTQCNRMFTMHPLPVACCPLLPACCYGRDDPSPPIHTPPLAAGL